MTSTQAPAIVSGGNPIAKLRARLAPLAKSALLHGGGYEAIRRLRPSRSVAILRYHAVCGPEGHAYAAPGICVSPEAFAEHVRYLATHYAVLPLSEVVERLHTQRPLPPNAVAITFDDGYADNLEAARVLNRHGLTATFYLTAGCLADGDPFWPAELRLLVAACGESSLRLEAGGQTFDITIGSRDREAVVRRLTRLFKSHPIPVRESMRDELRRHAGSPSLPRVMLRWEEVAEMRRLGMAVGSHTLTHPNLPSAGVEAAGHEIRTAKARLERETGAPVTMFSYPNGGAERYLTPEIERLVRESGHTAATTSRNAFATHASNLFALERIQVQERLEDLVFALEVERFGFQPAPRPGEAGAS